jgi:hypothetical protein
MDVIDIFSVIVAVNLGGVEGAMFSLCGNVISRLCGVYPEWKGVFEDSVAQFLTCLIIPFVHVALGGNILVTVIAYTVIRIIIMLPMDFVFYCTSVPKWIIEIIIGTILIIFINIIYVKLFGDFFDNLLKRGMNFSWILFIFATAVIIIFYASVFGFSKTIKGPSLIKIIKHYIHKPHKDKKSAEKNTDLEDMRKIKEMMK